MPQDPQDPNSVSISRVSSGSSRAILGPQGEVLYVRMPIGFISWSQLQEAVLCAFPQLPFSALCLGVRIDSENVPLFYVAPETFVKKLFLPENVKLLDEVRELVSVFAEEAHAGGPDDVWMDPKEFPAGSWAFIFDDVK